MCEQTPMEYKAGDVVWVKLGPCWWPGEVVSFEELPSDITESFKKPPLAVVKFFNEENYEFIRNLNTIYSYNCHKKYEFIKKGLDLHRAKNNFMEKFPSDVCTAEEKTNGNPNILNDPQLTPEKRTDYTDIFGVATPKRVSKDSPRFKSKNSFSKHNSSGGSSKKRSSLITHPRFLNKGKDDHEVRILIQESEEVKTPQQNYKCYTCGFLSTRVDVMVLHNKSHIMGVYTPVSVSKKSKQASPRRPKKARKVSPSKKSSTDDEPPVLTDFRSDLLAEWNDDEEDKDEEQSTNDSLSEEKTDSSKLKKKTMKMTRSTTATIEEDLALLEKGIPLCMESSSDESTDSSPILRKRKVIKAPSLDGDSSESFGNRKQHSKTLQAFLDFEKEMAKDTRLLYKSDSPVSFQKRKQTKSPATKAKKSKISVTPKPKTDITSDILAEWDDDDDEEEDVVVNKEKTDLPGEALLKKDDESKEELESAKKEQKSCFDFDEEEETELIARSEEGRKIPCVIPPAISNRISSFSEDISLEKETEDTEIENKTDLKELSPPRNLIDECNKEDSNDDAEAFNNILAETVVPKLPEIPQLLKCEQNFHSSKTIKFPDKDEEKTPALEVETNDAQEVAIERIEEESLVVAEIKTQMPHISEIIQNESGKDISINKEVKETADVLNPPAESSDSNKMDVTGKVLKDSSKQTEVPTKLINPKKRFVKTFEDETKKFEDETKKFEDETKKFEDETKKFEDETKKFEDETKNLIDKAHEEQQQVPEEMKNLNVSKLKTLLMSKINVHTHRKRDIYDFEEIIHKSRSSTKTETFVENVESQAILPDQPIPTSNKDLETSLKTEEFVDDSNSLIPKEEEMCTVAATFEKVEIQSATTVPEDAILETHEDKQELIETPAETELTIANDNQEVTEVQSDVNSKPQEEECKPQEVEQKIVLENNCEITEAIADDKALTTEMEIEFAKTPGESGNLTIVNEDDLVDKQVEITAQVETKPITLSSFSMDFEDSGDITDNHTVTVVTDKTDAEIKGKIKSTSLVDVEESINSFEINKQTKLEEKEEVDDKKTQDVNDETEGKKKLQELGASILENETTLESEMAKITDTSNEQNVVVETVEESTTSTKLLEILTDVAPKHEKPASKMLSSKPAKLIGRGSAASTSKTIIEKVIKPAPESETLVSVKKVSSKRSYQDVEDIDTFIIQKPLKKIAVSSPEESTNVQVAPTQKGKARILQQTIITPAGDIIQPIVQQNQNDDNMFDINSMPIVLDDQILTPESIENMPIVLQDSTTTVKSVTKKVTPQLQQQQQPVKLLNKSVTKEKTTQPSLIKQYVPGKATRVHKVYQTGSSKLLKNNPAVITQTGKPGKFIIVPSTSAPTGNKYTVGKRPPIIKRSPAVTKVQSIAPEPSGNKIMIVTNNLGQQQRVLLTPLQQKLLTCPTATSKIKTTGVQQQQQRPIAIKESAKTVQAIASPKLAALPQGQTFNQLKNIKVDPNKMKKIPVQNQKVYINKPSTSGKTIVIKNPQGQTVKRIENAEDVSIEQQVAEKLKAINRASAKSVVPKEIPVKPRMPIKKSYVKSSASKLTPVTKMPATTKATSSLPPLAPITTQKKQAEHQSQTVVTTNAEVTTQAVTESKTQEPKRLPHQLVIQDVHGNQTTITEGQILALPSEAIDGQPQSYVLVTLDETGNLAPLNNEALMSLDPNLNLGGDLGNMVLQIDQPETQSISATNQEVVDSPKPVVEAPPVAAPQNQENVESNPLQQQAVGLNSGDTTQQQQQQQLIITGDPVSTQKFLESLTEGNADLANLLANTKGNILIQAEGQQILINTDTENQMLLAVNPENLENTESNNGNPIFATPPIKNQDILAAALADTDVFQQDQSVSHSPSKLSPNSALYPIHAGNVLETSSMSSPIMTPLEVPSTNNKKIDDEADILSQVPKNVDLPITITDPNISQTVAQQQVVSLMAAELPSTLDLPLTIQDPNMSVTSTEMNSPSFVYSLPALDDAVDINQKTFSSSISMPLLTEDPEESLAETQQSIEPEAEEAKIEEEEETERQQETKVEEVDCHKSPVGNNSELIQSAIPDEDKTEELTRDNFMDAEGLCTMRGGICNSLSEPPPDMFDFSQSFETTKQSSTIDIPKNLNEASSTASDAKSDLSLHEEEDSNSDEKSKLDADSELKLEETKPLDDASLYSVSSNLEMRSHTPSTNTDDSCEIPVQPEIVTDLTLKNFQNDSGMTDSNFESNGSSMNDESDI